MKTAIIILTIPLIPLILAGIYVGIAWPLAGVIGSFKRKT